jgi:hypothetical protein
MINNNQLINSNFNVSVMKAILKCFLFFVLITVSFGAVGQNKQFYKVISFDEKIDFGNVDASAKWTINNSEAKVFTSLNGKQINDYVFRETGVYEIQFLETKKHSEECNHPMFPDKITVKVNPVKMTYNFSKIEFSEKIERGRNYENLIISVPVTITAIDNSTAKLPTPGLSIAGIGAALNAKSVDEEVVVRNGVQVLKYQVSGIVNAESYLMFDFSDFNGGVQTYNLPQIIN